MVVFRREAECIENSNFSDKKPILDTPVASGFSTLSQTITRPVPSILDRETVLSLAHLNRTHVN